MTIAHQSLKQLDDSLVSLILGNAQTQVFLRVSRQDAERLSKEAMNIVEQLLERDDHHLMQEMEHKFTLNEMWEVAFHNLAALKAREAYVTVKGVMEHPELMPTIDNTKRQQVEYTYDGKYKGLRGPLETSQRAREELEQKIKRFRKRDDNDSESGEPPEDLGFFD